MNKNKKNWEARICPKCLQITNQEKLNEGKYKCLKCGLNPVVDYVEYLLMLGEEIEHFKSTDVPRCFYCKIDFIKTNKEKTHGVWKPNCGCVSKDLKLCIG